jgi:hypothetical protein
VLGPSSPLSKRRIDYLGHSEALILLAIEGARGKRGYDLTQWIRDLPHPYSRPYYPRSRPLAFLGFRTLFDSSTSSALSLIGKLDYASGVSFTLAVGACSLFGVMSGCKKGPGVVREA